MNEADQIRLEHMLEAAYEVVEFTTGETRSSLDTDRKLMRAASMSIAIVGEAAARLSEELRGNNPHIPWYLIVGMRNFVMHEYFRLELDILWETAIESIPALISELEKLLPPETDEKCSLWLANWLQWQFPHHRPETSRIAPFMTYRFEADCVSLTEA